MGASFLNLVTTKVTVKGEEQKFVSLRLHQRFNRLGCDLDDEQRRQHRDGKGQQQRSKSGDQRIDHDESNAVDALILPPQRS